jgi:hypothetical protein
VDIAVMDYGLGRKQQDILKANNVILQKCTKDGNIVNIRYRDMHRFLKNKAYEQVLNCDGGDVIFQDNITPLFDTHKNQLRAVPEAVCPSSYVYYTIMLKSYPKELEKDIARVVIGKRLVGGFMLAPAKKFKKLCLDILKIVRNKNAYGPDQIALNYLFYKEGFFPLPQKYNFVIPANVGNFKIGNGVFLDKSGKIIPVIHNAGGGSSKMFRVIRNFGFGKNYNQFNYFAYFLVRLYAKLTFIIIPIFKLINKLSSGKE